MTTTVELEDHELRKIKGALWGLYDRHHGKGDSDTAKEYRELYEKIHAADE